MAHGWQPMAFCGLPTAHGGKPTAHGGQPTANGGQPTAVGPQDVTGKLDKQSNATLQLCFIVMCYGRCLKPVSNVYETHNLSKYLEFNQPSFFILAQEFKM